MKNLILLDVCTPDYFTGHSLPAIEVLVNSDTTIGELIDDLWQEYNLCIDFYENAYEEQDFKNAIEKLKTDNSNQLNEKFLVDNEKFSDYKPDTDTDTDTYEQDSLYAYFVLGNFRISKFSGVSINTVE